MQLGTAVKVLMAINAIVLLVPATLFYVIGAMGWFLLFVPAAILTLVEGVWHNGWPQGPLFQTTQGFGMLSFSAYMLAAGAGLAATWIALVLAYSGVRLKDIPRLLWVGFVAGWTLAAPLLWSVSPTPNYLQDRLGDYLFVQSLFGVGPLIFSAFTLLWLYWNGKQKLCETQ